MTSPSWSLSLPGMIISSFWMMNEHVFQSSNELKVIKVKPASSGAAANQHYIDLCQINIQAIKAILTWVEKKVGHTFN